MVEETKKVDLDGKHQQLLDINKETKNFISEFSITPGILDFEIPYKVAVVTQEDLDVNQESIKFQDMQKSFSGTVKNLEGVAQNYYLAIKSEKPMKSLTFKNKLTEILSPDPQPQPQPHQPQPHQPHQPLPSGKAHHMQGHQQPLQTELNQKRHRKPVETSNKTLKCTLAIFTLIIGCFLMYYFWKTQNLNGDLLKPKYY